MRTTNFCNLAVGQSSSLDAAPGNTMLVSEGDYVPDVLPGFPL
jgi:hypothetical protein